MGTCVRMIMENREEGKAKTHRRVNCCLFCKSLTRKKRDAFKIRRQERFFVLGCSANNITNKFNSFSPIFETLLPPLLVLPNSSSEIERPILLNDH